MSSKGYKHTPEAIKKMSESRKGKRNSFWGKTHSDETKKKQSKSHKGKIAWNKDKECLQLRGEKNGFWKGEKAKYNALHMWVRNRKGKASNYECDCGEQALEWSNKDHKYNRCLDDYIARCKTCHQKYDLKFV